LNAHPNLNALVYTNPTAEELEQVSSGGEVRAIFEATNLYAWNPRLASHDEVLKKMGIDESAIFAILNLDRKTVRVVRGSGLQGSRIRAHPYIQRLGFLVAV
jgi:hypothetical protein